MEKIIPLREVVKILPFWSKNTIRQLAYSGNIPHVRIRGKVYYDESEIMKFKESIIKREGGNNYVRSKGNNE